MENVVEFLDWLVALNINHYVTDDAPEGYDPRGGSHFYLSGSLERFTSEEMIKIWNNEADKELNENWQYAISQHAQWKRRH